MGLLARTPIYTHCGVYICFQPTKYTLEINHDHFQRTHQRQLSIVQALLLKDLAGRVVTAISQPGAHLGILTGLDTPFLIHSLEVSKRLKSFSPTLEQELWISGATLHYPTQGHKCSKKEKISLPVYASV